MPVPADLIKRGHDNGTTKAVAVVKISEAAYVNEPVGDAHPWRAKARIFVPVSGSNLPEYVTFERGWGSAACEWNTPKLPKKGDQWVVYFTENHSGELVSRLVIPLGEALEFDPRFRASN